MTLNITRRRALGAGFSGLALASAACTSSGLATATTPTSAPDAEAFEKDRAAILAMAGTFHVRFETRETVSFLPDYEPFDSKVNLGDEVVRVVEDTGGVIRLQHILVVAQDGQSMVVRHWRQDWIYEPESVLEFKGANVWRVIPAPASERAGRWAQVVYNTDDSPRYGGIGNWEHDYSVSRWTSARGLRPIARRDAVRNPEYKHYACLNRHALTPTGWVHEQDNAKLGERSGAKVTFVHEQVVNAYDRSDRFDISAADTYLAATQEFWNEVRLLWEQRIGEFGGMRLVEGAQTGSAAGPVLMQLAEDLKAGKLSQAEAITSARSTIAAFTERP